MSYLLSTTFFVTMMISIQTGMCYRYIIPHDVLYKMTDYFWTWSNVSILEQFNRRSYILNKNSQLGWDVFRLLQEENHSYYRFRRSCEVSEIVRRMLSNCFTIEIDNRSIAVVHDGEFHRTGNLEVVIPQNTSDPHSNFPTFLATQFNMKRFMFAIFVIEQNTKRLAANVNPVSSTSSKLPIPDAFTFTVNVIEQTNEKETELVIILCLMIDEMRGYMGDDDDDKEDFYDNS